MGANVGKILKGSYLTAFVALAWYFLYVRNADTMFFMQDRGWWNSTFLFWNDCVSVPGGLLSWAGAYLTQYFFYPAIGTSMLISMVNVQPINSPLPESYPSFSSNDRWVMFESRRDDGNYTRTFISYFDREGRLHKPFEMPAEDPEYFRLLLRSWSRPEFMKEPVRITPRQFYEKILTEPIKVHRK